jgi:type II protein arginine methyltransferase
MLNDDTRNSAYKKAIKLKVEQNYDTVLDIGTGTGLLSIYTRMAGAKKITACERAEVMVQIADEVLKNNSCEDVVLVPKYSTDIVCGKDVYEKFNLIVTEILDSGVFGEGVLQTLIHAKEKLLDTNGVILPNSVKIFIAGFQSETIAAQNVVTNSSFQDFIFLDGFNLCSKNDDHYDSLEIRLLTDFKFVTSIGMAMEINFNDLSQMRAHLKGKSGPLVKLACECEGYIDGFLVWFRLHLCENIYLETAPQVQNCWNQAIIRVRSRHHIYKHQTINLSMSAMSGILKVSHTLDSQITRVYEIDNHIIRYINDSGYLNALENAILQKLKKRNRKSFEHVLDFSPFPYTGLILLKEHRAKHLYVSNDNEAFIKFLAQKNCISESCIRFLKTPLDHFVDDANLLMDLIILAPFETVGTLRADQISVYPTLASKLKPNGIIVPIKIELYGVLISSEWLVKMSRVNNAEMNELKIAELVNKYQIENSIDIGEFEYTNLTQTFKISDVELDDQLHETSLSVELTNRDRCIDGILCTYKIQFVANCDMLSSYRKFSHIQRTAFLCQKGENAGGQSHVKVHFVQNHGIIKCHLSS